jgi:hypothetical protein
LTGTREVSTLSDGGRSRRARREQLSPISSAPLRSGCATMAERGEARMLRSLKDLEGYSVSATDSDVGGVEDFLIDDERWVVRLRHSS